MPEYSVKITGKPFGISLVGISDIDTDNIEHTIFVLDRVVHNSIADVLGVSIGDELIAINNQSVSNMSISDISKSLNSQTLPFYVTFCKFAEDESELEFSLIDDIEFNNHHNAINDKLSNEQISISPIGPDYNPKMLHYISSFSDYKQSVENHTNIKSDINLFINGHIVMDTTTKQTADFFCFNQCSINKNNHKICLVSSKGLNGGVYQWSFEILQCDVLLQEVGVVGISVIDNIEIDSNGIKETSEMKARAVFGNQLSTNSAYYGSYNENNKIRCYKDLAKKMRWRTGDIITVILDLNCFKIRFLFNGEKVRKCLSLQSNAPYFPFISFAGNCKYILRNELV